MLFMEDKVRYARLLIDYLKERKRASEMEKENEHLRKEISRLADKVMPF